MSVDKFPNLLLTDTAAQELKNNVDKSRAFSIIKRVLNVTGLSEHNIRMDNDDIDGLQFFVIAFIGPTINSVNLKDFASLCNDKSVCGVIASMPVYREHIGIRIYVRVFYESTLTGNPEGCSSYIEKVQKKWIENVKTNGSLLQFKPPENMDNVMENITKQIVYSYNNPPTVNVKLADIDHGFELKIEPLSDVDVFGVIKQVLHNPEYEKRIVNMQLIYSEDGTNKTLVATLHRTISNAVAQAKRSFDQISHDNQTVEEKYEGENMNPRKILKVKKSLRERITNSITALFS